MSQYHNDIYLKPLNYYWLIRFLSGKLFRFKSKIICFFKIEGSGKPLLILHGFLGMSDNWKSLGTQFAVFSSAHARSTQPRTKYLSDDFNY
jgi:pimeloyl-ACP methyl ester carboxylesterase